MSYKYETQYDSPNFTEGNNGREFIVIHWWDAPENNPSYEGTISTLCNPNRGASAHFVATGTDRRVACLVDLTNTAWHAGNWDANTKSIGIECDPRCRDEDYDVVAELIANIRSVYPNLPLRRHSEFMATRCPGNWDLTRLDALARTKDGSGDWGIVTDIKPAKPVVEPPKPIITPEPVIIPAEPETPVVEPPVAQEEPVATPQPTLWELIKKLVQLILGLFKPKG